MNWQFWLLVALLLVLLAGLTGLAWMVWLQNRSIAILGDDLKKSIDSYAAFEKSLLRSLEGHSAHIIETTKYLQAQIADAEAMGEHHEMDARAARAELEMTRSEVKKFKSILARKGRQATTQEW